MQIGRFPCKIALHLKKSATKFLSVNTVSNKVVRHSLPLIVPKLPKGGSKTQSGWFSSKL